MQTSELSSRSTEVDPGLTTEDQPNCRTRYYICYPRRFNNEYTVYVATSPKTIAWCEAKYEANDNFERISRKEAIHRGIRVPLEHSKDNSGDPFYGGLFSHFLRGSLGSTQSARLKSSAEQLLDYVQEEEFMEQEGQCMLDLAEAKTGA